MVQQIKLNFSEKLGYGFVNMAVNLIFNVVSTYLLFFYTNVYGLRPADSALMFLIVKVVDAIGNPLWGTFVDKRTTKFGKYRGYLLYLALPYAFFSVIAFITPNVGYTLKLVYAYTTYVFLSLLNVGLCINGALPAAMTRDNDEITVLNSYSLFCSNTGGVLVSFCVPLLVTNISGSYSGPQSQIGWSLTMGIFAILGLFGLLFGFKTVKEHYHMDEADAAQVSVKDFATQAKANKPYVLIFIYMILAFTFMTMVNSGASYYVTYNMANPNMLKYFNVLGTLPSFLIVPAIPWMKKKMGRKGMMHTFSVLLIVGLMILAFSNAHNIALAMFGKLLASLGMIVTTGYMWAFVPEITNYGEWKTGKRENAIISSTYQFAVAIGLAIGGVIPGYILQAVGFNANLSVQSANAMSGILWIMCYIPALLILLSMGLIQMYPITDKLMNQMNIEIDAQNAK
ncbi:glycoside-pentoside-hexuronide (GPH):cation symporter [Ligilactobacillus sp. WILCCON 0076]|uniref:Glycoside-pentoside-hexuronide (GPH):cation symporter n=1 Tax=Ligilactobacillus ubinensis TaxID=2876789 RepID=A0A9X2JME4_9LACO|nr:glycoside-pentoside-hexuronide (GPH):cation symporter [Ligilactobacillus ubinensis]MCP0887026.1 glycoside-pentoside-hexuronide (GPH):cation symporter [Ligilactobacillus ubinensis]